jgi:protein TonB
MTDFALTTKATQQPDPGRERPPLRPSWLHPLSAFAVVAAHVSFFAIFMYWVRPQLVSLNSIDAQLVQEGDFEAALAPDGDSLEEEPASDALADSLPPSEPVLPPPPVMEPEAEPAPDREKPKEARAEKPKLERKRVDRPAADKANASRQAQERGRYGLPGGRGEGAGASREGSRFGVPGGRGKGAGASQATCLAGVASSMRRRMPGATSLGPGTAFVTFHVNVGGGISGVSATGTTPAHAALARRIVASSRGPGNCAAAFASQHITFE